MEVVHRICCGLDVHKKTVTACLRVERRSQVRVFGTMTEDLLALGDWLAEAGCEQVAMEATGVYWKPVWNLLEDRFRLMLVNARHIKAVPGRKTDVKDAEWIAQLLQHGLLSPSVVPPQPIRELRDLTRHRTTLVHERAAVINRIQKLLEDANIKLAAVISDVTGASGMEMLAAIVKGDAAPATLAEMARGRMREKRPQLEQALTGRVREHHRFLLQELLDQYRYLQEAVARVQARIDERLRPFAEALARLDTIPGINLVTASAVVAETGLDMRLFSDHDHIVSWGCVCPGNNESAGKQKSGKCRRGNKWLRGALAEAAWAVSRTQTALGALYRRIARRRGKKRAIVAVSRQLLIIIYHLLRDGGTYRELGPDYYDQRQRERAQRYHTKRLEALGLQVTVQPIAA